MQYSSPTNLHSHISEMRIASELLALDMHWCNVSFTQSKTDLNTVFSLASSSKAQHLAIFVSALPF